MGPQTAPQRPKILRYTATQEARFIQGVSRLRGDDLISARSVLLVGGSSPARATTSTNASLTVWDSVNFISSKRITITYVRRSAWMITNHTPEEGSPLDETYDGDTMASGIL